MKEKMTSIDIAAIINELNSIKDAKVEKSYQLTENELLFKFYHFGEGKKNLMVEAGKRIHFTEYPRPAPERPPDFPMVLRKHTKGGNIREFRQHNFDRVIEWQIEKEDDFKIIAELFGKGNIILINKENKIINALKHEEFKDRKIRKGKTYKYPPSGLNPIKLKKQEFIKELGESNTDLVRTIATEMNLGGLYAEEICEKADVEKNKSASELSDQEINQVFQSIKQIMKKLKKGDLNPHIVYENGIMVDVLPIKLQKYKNNKKKEFKSFNKALDEFFSKREINEVEEKKENKFKERLNSLKGRKNGQLTTAKQYEQDYEDGIKKGDLIYKYYKELNQIMELINEKREKHSWEKIKTKIKEAKQKEIAPAHLIKKINQNKGKIIVKLDEMDVKLDIRKNLTENAKEKYEEAKKKKRKAKGARKAAEETKKEINKLKSKGKEEFKVRETPQKKIRNKDKWYDKFRWTKSTNDFLIVGGRNADQNEEIVKKHMQENDLFFHTQLEGGSATIVKTEGKKVPEKTKKEAAKFAASNSIAWKNYYSADVYQVNANQVTKNPESGEYVQKGSFVIRGEREYYRNVKLEYAVGLEINKLTRLIGGPPRAVRKHAKYYKEIEPGDQDRSKVSKKIEKELKEKSSAEEQKIVEKLVSQDEIERFFPPGKLRIKQ